MNDETDPTSLQSRAGSIAKQSRAYAAALVKPGVPLLEIAEKTEAFIVEKGGRPAFPVNLSSNSLAAHSTPSAQDASVVGESDVVKVDVGVHIDGWIADTAVTVDVGGNAGKLLESAQKALEAALSVAKAGVSVNAIGAEIEHAIASAGFKPIENLCGHSLEQWVLHAGTEIPNIDTGSYVLREGDVFAIEPFASTGSGIVRESSTEAEIYSLANPKPVRLDASRKFLAIAMEDYRLLPFAKRWLQEFPSLNLAINDLRRQGVLHAYPILHDTSDSIVAQAEATIVVEKDSVRVLT